MCSKGSSSSRPAKKKWSARMPGPPSSSRRARNKWPARSPASQSRTCGAGHQRLRHRRWRRLRVDPYRRFRRRKRERKRARQCHCGPDNSSRHRRRRRHVQHASASLKIFVRHPIQRCLPIPELVIGSESDRKLVYVRSGGLFEVFGGPLLPEMLKLTIC